VKILVIYNVPNNRTGGAARYVHHTRDELIKLGHEVDLLFAEDVPAPFGWKRLSGLTYPLFMLPGIFRTMRSYGRYDIINIHTLEGAVYVFLRKIFTGLPMCVITSQGSDELRWELEKEEERLGYRNIRPTAKLFYYNLIVRQGRFATKHGDHVVTAARSEKEFYERVYGRDSTEVTVIPNGVAKEFFIERDYGRPMKKLLFLGGWEWRKGTRYLVEAFSRVAVEDSEVTLSLVGTGMGEEAVKTSFPVNLHDRVHVVPRVAAQDVPGVYAEHDLFVFPSMFESMSLVVPEAMASGMPIVTTRTCGMQDIIDDGVTGFLVPPRDSEALATSMQILLNDPLLCAKLGQAAQKKAKEITWDKIARQTLQVYERLLRGSGNARCFSGESQEEWSR
jgi:glycosyltransferase involved in cell wall biosynthesis